MRTKNEEYEAAEASAYPETKRLPCSMAVCTAGATLLLSALCLSAPPSASAQGPAVQRGLTLPARTLRIDVGPSDDAILDGVGMEIGNRRGLRLGRTPGGNASAVLNIGAAYGITDNFEIGSLLLPIDFAPGAGFGDLEFYGRYRFVHSGGFELGLHITLQVPTNTDLGFGFALPMRYRISNAARIDTGVEIELLVDDTRANLDLPFTVLFQATRAFYIGPRSGVMSPRFSELWVPLGLTGGYTVHASRRVAVDLTGAFTWPAFFATGGFGDAVNPGYFEALLGVNLAFGL